MTMTPPTGPAAFYAGAEHQPFTVGDGVAGALLLHGFTGTPAEMRPLSGHLATAGWTVHAPLLPGFGPEIGELGRVSAEAWLTAAQTHWHALRRFHQPGVIVGYSMGGAIAVQLAAAVQPDYLVLLAPFTRLADPTAQRLMPLLAALRRTFKPFAGADFADPAVRAQVTAIAPGVDLDDPAVQDSLRDALALPATALAQLRRTGLAAQRAAAQLTCPTLVIQGRHDTTVLPAHTRRLLTQLGGPVHYIEIDAAHNLVNGTESAAVVEPIMAFLAHHAPRSQSNGRGPVAEPTPAL